MAANWAIQVLLTAQVYVYCAASERESFTIPPPVCPGDIATFTCTVCNTTANAATYWQVGTEPECFILHSGINPMEPCGPTDVLELITTDGGCYHTVFNITAHRNLRGANVQCFVPVQQGRRTVGNGSMDVIGAPPRPFFYALNAGDIAHTRGSNEVTLSLRWSVPDRYRYTGNITGYVITADPPVPQHGSIWEIDGRTTQQSVSVPVGAVVKFTVRAESCAEGRESTTLVVRAKVPQALPRCTTTAVYDSSSNKLTGIIIRWPRAVVPRFQVHVAPGLSAKTRDYTIVVNRRIVEQSRLCTGEQCTFSWEVADQGTANYKVSVAANNVVGQGEVVVCMPNPVASENELVEVDVDVSTLNGRVRCKFLEAFLIAFWTDAYCEIRLGTDPTFTHLELMRRSREIGGAGENVSITVGPLIATTNYFFNVSVILQGQTTPAVVIQGFITTPTTCNTSDLIGSSEPSNQTCYIDGEIGHMLELNNVEVCYNGTTPGSVARYNCSAGYVLSAGAISPRTCRDDGQWDGSSVISCELTPVPLTYWLGPVLAAIFIILLCAGGILLSYFLRKRLNCVHILHWIKGQCMKRGGHEREEERGQKEDAVNDTRLEVVETDGIRQNGFYQGLDRMAFTQKGTRRRTQRKNGVANGGSRNRRNGRAKCTN